MGNEIEQIVSILYFEKKKCKKKQEFSVTGFRIMKMRDQKQAQNQATSSITIYENNQLSNQSDTTVNWKSKSVKCALFQFKVCVP